MIRMYFINRWRINQIGLRVVYRSRDFTDQFLAIIEPAVRLLPEHRSSITQDGGSGDAFVLALPDIFGCFVRTDAVSAIRDNDDVDRHMLFNVPHNGSATAKHFIVRMGGKHQDAAGRNISGCLVGNEQIFQ